MFAAVHRFVAAWKWVIGFTAVLLLTLNFTRRFMDWLEMRNLQGVLSLSILVALLGVVAASLLLIRRNRGRIDGPTVLRFLAILSLFLGSMIQLTTLTVERVHFLQYGILAALSYQAAGRRHTGLRRFAYAGVAAGLIGFLDEFVQGLLPIRYYDNRDLLLNVVAIGLVLLAFFLLPLWRRTDPGLQRRKSCDQLQAGRISNTPRFLPTDWVVLVIVAGLIPCVRWIGTVPWNPQVLAGSWQRQNLCGTLEWMEIGPSGVILWRDADGREARGTYRILGNRLDGPMLHVEVLIGGQEGSCAWNAGQLRDRYFQLEPDRLLFNLEPLHPFVRQDP
jgi:VanZ family protein